MGQTIRAVSVEATEQVLITTISQHRADRVPLSLMSLPPVQAWMYLYPMLRALVRVRCRSPLASSPTGWTAVSIGDIDLYLARKVYVIFE